MKYIRRFFVNPALPVEYRANFIHFYLDIGWFALLSGSALNFQNVYAARLGASSFQIGLLGAIPALVSLLLAIPAGIWLTKHPIHRAVFWTSVLYRIGFLFWAFLPSFFDAQGQVWGLTSIILLQAIPLTALSVGFNTLFASAVPVEWRASVAAKRNIVLSVVYMGTSLGTGWLLEQLPFPFNYQVIFFIGFLGAAMSSVHLYFIRPLPDPESSADRSQPGPGSPLNQTAPRPSLKNSLRLDIWKTPFRVTLLVLLFFHLAQYLAIPLFPIYFVNELGLTDEHIGIGTALFYLTVLLGSTQLSLLVRKTSHKAVTGWGIVGMSLYPLFLAFSSQVWEYYAISILGGFVWAMVGGAQLNYLLEACPPQDRPSYLAWYTIVLNACALAGSLLGPAFATLMGISLALIFASILRGLSGLALLKWG
ncbi:MAG: MFS transporter [Anaerolineales bacterium]|nr:MFS transporter [Anaerolineales bacterium]